MNSASYIPADDVILRGYCGPIRVFHPTVREWELTTYAWGQVIIAGRVVPADGLTMEMPIEEAQARDWTGRVMAEGVRCAHDWQQAGYARRECATCHAMVAQIGFQCRGCGGIPEDDVVPCHGSVCRACKALGVHSDSAPGVFRPGEPVRFVRPPTPIEHLLDRPGSRLTAGQSAVLCAWSYQSWRGGGSVLRGLLPKWAEVPDTGAQRYEHESGGPCCVGRSELNTEGWGWWFKEGRYDPTSTSRGTEIGPEGRACADRAALAHNFALLNEDGSVTTPELPTETK